MNKTPKTIVVILRPKVANCKLEQNENKAAMNNA